MDLSPEHFRRLMNWLHPNSEEAGQEYQRIHTILIKHFKNHGCSSPDKLADATMDRAAQTLETEQIENWAGKKERYFFRVAYYIVLEEKSKTSLEVQIPDRLDVRAPDKDEEAEIRSHCLTKCLRRLSNSDQELIVKYYHGTKAIKIMNRRALAADRKLTMPLLRVRAHRLRAALKTCMENCLRQST